MQELEFECFNFDCTIRSLLDMEFLVSDVIPLMYWLISHTIKHTLCFPKALVTQMHVLMNAVGYTLSDI